MLKRGSYMLPIDSIPHSYDIVTMLSYHPFLLSLK